MNRSIQDTSTMLDFNPIRILYVCHDWTESGANRSLLDWLSAADKTRISPFVLLPRKNPVFQEKLKNAGCEVWVGNYFTAVKSLKKESLARVAKQLIKRVLSVITNPLSRRRIYKKALAAHIQIIHSNSFATLEGFKLSKSLGVPHVWHIREFCEEDHYFTHYENAKLSNMCGDSWAIFISDVIKNKYKALYEFVDSRVIFNRVANQSEQKNRAFMEDGICRIIIVGYLGIGKGQIEAINAIKKLHDKGLNVDLTICGQGDKAFLNDYISPSDERFVHVLGYRDDVPRIRQNIDIALVCSQMEAFGRVTIESLYAENVVIGSNAGCTPDIITDGKNGFLYELGDVDSLASRIEYCMNNKELMNELTIVAQAEAMEKYSKDIAPKIISFYQDILRLGTGSKTEI